MEFVIPIAMVLGFIAIGIFAVKYSSHLAAKRTEAMQEFAANIGLDFQAEENTEVLSRLQSFNLFNQGRSRKMRNVIVGETDLARIAIFDYRYTTGSGKNTTTHHRTVVSMEADALDVPSFTLRPESFFDAVGSALGFQDIDFDEHPRFSKMFVLKGDSEEVIREFFDKDLLDFFAGKKGIYFEVHRGAFIYYRGSEKPEKLRELMEEGYSVFSAFTKRQERG